MSGAAQRGAGRRESARCSGHRQPVVARICTSCPLASSPFGQPRQFKRDAESVHGGRDGEKAAVKPHAMRRWRRQAVGGKPVWPADLLVVAVDERMPQQVFRLADETGKLGMQRGVTVSSPSGRTTTPSCCGPPIDDIDVEFVGRKARVVGARRKPDFDIGMSGEKLRQPRCQPLRRKTRRRVNPQAPSAHAWTPDPCRGGGRQRPARHAA